MAGSRTRLRLALVSLASVSVMACNPQGGIAVDGSTVGGPYLDYVGDTGGWIEVRVTDGPSSIPAHVWLEDADNRVAVSPDVCVADGPGGSDQPEPCAPGTHIGEPDLQSPPRLAWNGVTSEGFRRLVHTVLPRTIIALRSDQPVTVEVQVVSDQGNPVPVGSLMSDPYGWAIEG